MEPNEALSILKQVAWLAPVNGATHVQAQNAIAVLEKLIQDYDVLEEEKKKDLPDLKETGVKKTKDGETGLGDK
jgi:hypothetical protein